MSSTRTLYLPNHHEASLTEYQTPLFLVPFPNFSNDNDTVDILAYGGDDGCLYRIPSTSGPPRLIRKYDDCVRAVAVAPDGRRVAVGFDDGSSKIYHFDTFDGQTNHPFGEQVDDELPSQQDATEFLWEGPALQASVRQMAFDPRSGTETGYYLAIVSEDGNNPLIICDVTSQQTASQWYLAEESGEEHAGGGVRSLAYSYSGADHRQKLLLSTLGMDGKLVTWDVDATTMKDPSLEWEVCSRDHSPCVGKVDLGEGMGGDAADRACAGTWGLLGKKTNTADEYVGCLILPGKVDVQFRICPLNRDNTTKDCKIWLSKQRFVVEEGNNAHKDTIVSVAFEPSLEVTNKRRFITGGRDGKLMLWEMTMERDVEEPTVTGTFIGQVAFDRKTELMGIPPVTSIVWLNDGKESLICAADASGAIIFVRSKSGLFVEAVDAGKQQMSIDGNQLSDTVTHIDTKLTNSTARKESRLRRLVKDVADDNNTDDGDDALFDDDSPTFVTDDLKERNQSQKSTQKKSDPSRFIDDEADEASNDDSSINNSSTNIRESTPSSPNKYDSLYDDVNYQTLPQDDVDPVEHEFENHNDPITQERIDIRDQSSLSFTPLQPAFAPSATPITERRRILCWNHVGVVTIYPDADSPQYNQVDISFHDSASFVGGRRPINFTDNLGFIVGTLGDEGALFASDLMEDDEDLDEDEEELQRLGVLSEVALAAVKRSRKRKNRGDGNSSKGSHVYFNRFETFGRNADKDWVVTLPDGERVLGCATGRGWNAVISSRRYMRLFTTAGIQGPVVWLPGEPVTIVGRDRFVGVFHHRSVMPMKDGTQLMGYSIFDGVNGATIFAGEVSGISPGATLMWAGFTDVCALSIMDSDGMLSMLSHQTLSDGRISLGHWVPMLDTLGLKKAMSDMYWPVEVHGGKLICVLLRGGKEYPDAGIRPVTTTLSLRIPLAIGLTKCSQLEELCVRGMIALSQRKTLYDYKIEQGEANRNDIEDEYMQLSAQIDKVTLKLFNETIKAGKVERALSLINRLHLERSFEIAIQASDRTSHRILCDRIEEEKMKRFPALNEEEFFDDSNSVDSRIRSGSYDEYPITSQGEQIKEMQRISPDHSPPSRQHTFHTNATDEESPQRELVKRKLEDTSTFQTKRINPFAKKRMESPAKKILEVPRSPPKLTLTRQSTFSTKAREKQRSCKQIV